MWLWHFKKDRKGDSIKMPRCPHCAHVLRMRVHEGIPIYVCPRDEGLLQSATRAQQAPEPTSTALIVREAQVTGPINLRAMKHGDLMQYHRLMHPKAVDTREVRAIRLKNKARRQQ